MDRDGIRASDGFILPDAGARAGRDVLSLCCDVRRAGKGPRMPATRREPAYASACALSALKRYPTFQTVSMKWCSTSSILLLRRRT